MHLLYVKNFKKESSGWVYNLHNSVILFIDKTFFSTIDISGNDKNVKVDISSLLDNPSNLFGVINENDEIEYTTKEIEMDSTDSKVPSDVSDISFDPNFSFGDHDADQDRDHTKLTRLEYACLVLKVPSTGKEWLDKLILQSRKLDKA